MDEQERALRVILRLGGGLVTGAAGTGKSVVIKKLRAALCERNETVFVCAYTHAAAKLVGGWTISRLLHYKMSLHNAWILIDEYSLVPNRHPGTAGTTTTCWRHIRLIWRSRGPIRADARSLGHAVQQGCRQPVAPRHVLSGTREIAKIPERRRPTAF